MAAKDESDAESTELLRGQTVLRIHRPRPATVAIEFASGKRMFIDSSSEPLEISITDGTSQEDDGG